MASQRGYASSRFLIESGLDPRAEVGRQEELSVLFADIRDFTSYSELRSPEQVVAMLNEHLGLMANLPTKGEFF